jgi:hypothetical protein
MEEGNDYYIGLLIATVFIGFLLLIIEDANRGFPYVKDIVNYIIYKRFIY